MRLVGSKITSFGMNAAGEIYLSTDRGDNFVFGIDPRGEVALYELSHA